MSNEVVMVRAARTPVGSFNGAFATMPAMIWERSSSRPRWSEKSSELHGFIHFA